MMKLDKNSCHSEKENEHEEDTEAWLNMVCLGKEANRN